MNFSLDHFIFSKFLYGEILTGPYSVIARSSGLRDEDIREALNYNVCGSLPRYEVSPKYHGYAFILLNTKTAALVSYRRHSKLEDSGHYPQYLHYVLCPTSFLEQIDFDLIQILNTESLYNDLSTSKLQILEPIEFESRNNTFFLQDISPQPGWLESLPRVLNQNPIIIRHEFASPKQRLSLACFWQSIIPLEYKYLFSFTTNTTFPKNSIRITFVDNSVYPNETENRFENLYKNSENIPGSIFTNWVGQIIDVGNPISNEIEKLRKTRISDIGKNLAITLDLFVRYNEWHVSPDDSPERIERDIDDFKFLMTTEELTESYKTLLCSFIRSGKYLNAINLLKTHINTLCTSPVLKDIAVTEKAPLLIELFNIGLKDTIVKPNIEIMYLSYLEILSSFNDFDNYVLFFENILKFYQCTDNLFLNALKQISFLPQDYYLKALTIILKAYPEYGLEFLEINSFDSIATKFPKLAEFLRLTSSKTGNFEFTNDQQQLIIDIYEEVGHNQIWLVHLLLRAIETKKCIQLNSTIIMKALEISLKGEDQEFSKKWSFIWDVLTNKVQQFDDLDPATLDALFNWSLKRKDNKIAVITLATILYKSLSDTSNFELILNHIDQELKLKNIIHPKELNDLLITLIPTDSNILELLKWIVMSTSFLHLYNNAPAFIPIFYRVHRLLLEECFQIWIKKRNEIGTISNHKFRVEIFLLGFYSKNKKSIARNKIQDFLSLILEDLLIISIYSSDEASFLMRVKQLSSDIDYDLYSYYKAIRSIAYLLDLPMGTFYKKICILNSSGFQTEAFILGNVLIEKSLKPSELTSQILVTLLDYILRNPSEMSSPLIRKWLLSAKKDPSFTKSICLYITKNSETNIVEILQGLKDRLSKGRPLLRLQRRGKSTPMMLLDLVERLYVGLSYSIKSQ